MPTVWPISNPQWRVRHRSFDSSIYPRPVTDPVRPALHRFVATALLAAVLAAGCGSDGRQYELPQPTNLEPVAGTADTVPLPLVESGPNAMMISSPAFAAAAAMPTRFSISDQNLSPSLSFVDIPDSAVEMALLVRDPDRPFIHWLVTGIPADTPSIGEGGLPVEATEHANDAADFGWFGPDVTEGASGRIQFELFIFDTPLEILDSSSQDDVIDAIDANQTGRASFMARYGSG